MLELRREVCLVPQLPALLEGSVRHNVAFGAELAGRSADVEPGTGAGRARRLLRASAKPTNCPSESSSA